jgi:hypothetical protein
MSIQEINAYRECTADLICYVLAHIVGYVRQSVVVYLECRAKPTLRALIEKKFQQITAIDEFKDQRWRN